MEECKSSINSFCYVCGKHVTDDSKRYFSDAFKSAYVKKFEQPVFEDVWWVPNSACKTCYNGLLAWSKSERKMKIRIPMFWTEPREGFHVQSNCYACANHIAVPTKPHYATHEYKRCECADLPAFFGTIHEDTFPSPALTYDTLPTATTETETETVDYSLYDSDPIPSGSSGPRLITQDRLNFMAAELELSQRKAEKLASLLKQDRVLDPTARVRGFRNRQKVFQDYFLMNDERTYAYCNRVPELMKEMGIEHKYYDHEWKVCCDLKVVAILQGMQSGYTKYNCFLCEWDSRYNESCQYLKTDWNIREPNVPGSLNVQKEVIVKRENVPLQPLHIKLGIVKNFVKHVYLLKKVGKCLHKIFPKLSKDKLKGGKKICPTIDMHIVTNILSAVCLFALFPLIIYYKYILMVMMMEMIN